jgi:hypothetical protein
MIRLVIPHLNMHITQFERHGQFWTGKTPPCDQTWPDGWLEQKRAELDGLL